MEIVEPEKHTPYSHREWTCQSCDNVFKKKKVLKNRPPKYCSIKCSGLAKAKIKTCKHCNDDFYNHANKMFCSMDCAGKSKRGMPLSDEHKKRLSEVKKGKPIKHFVENKADVLAKISKALSGKPQPWNRGPNHPNYKDGGKAKWARQKDMGRVEYKAWRRSVFERDDYTCQMCNERGGDLCADHIKPYSQHPQLRYDTNNGRTLCKTCHISTPTYGGKIKSYGRES